MNEGFDLNEVKKTQCYYLDQSIKDLVIPGPKVTEKAFGRDRSIL